MKISHPLIYFKMVSLNMNKNLIYKNQTTGMYQTKDFVRKSLIKLQSGPGKALKKCKLHSLMQKINLI